MVRCITLVTLLVITVGQRANAELIAFNRDDTSTFPYEQPRRIDTSINSLSSFQSVGINAIQALDFDSATGILYGLHVDTDYPVGFPNGESTMFLASWAQDGSLIDNRSLGVFGNTGNGDPDLAVYNGMVAVRVSDVDSRYAYDPVLRFDTNGNSLGTFDIVGQNLYRSLDFDSADGLLYGLNVIFENNQSTFAVATWGLDGKLISNQSLGVLAIDNYGSDISVQNGIVALSRTDTPTFGEGTMRFDRFGNPLGSYQSVGIDAIQSLDFDAATGTLYGLHVDTDNSIQNPNGASTLFLASWAQDGSLISNQSLRTPTFTNLGSDLAVFSQSTAVPEPSTFLSSMLAISIAALVRRKSRKAGSRASDVGTCTVNS